MNKEILFKAKPKDWKDNPHNNQWVEGFYCNKQETTYCFKKDYERYPVKTLHYIVQDCMTDWGLPNELRLIEIDEETLCRYTYYNDKNNRKIWENDIVRYNTYDDFDCYSVVKMGEYTQDGSGGEYGGRKCIGVYVEVDNFTCPDWADDDPTYFPMHMSQQNLLEVASDCEVLGDTFDNKELLRT